MILPAPPRKPVQANELVIGHNYHTPSGMGGVYEVDYKGTNEFDKHVFEFQDEEIAKYGIPMRLYDYQVPKMVFTCHCKLKDLDEWRELGGKF